MQAIKYVPINGFTRASIKALLRKRFKGKSVSDATGTCHYRLEVNGEERACVAGCFISDRKYNGLMEGKSIDHIWDTFKLGRVMPLKADAMVDFQQFHDNLDESASPAKQLKELCDWVDFNVSDRR